MLCLIGVNVIILYAFAEKRCFCVLMHRLASVSWGKEGGATI